MIMRNKHTNTTPRRFLLCGPRCTIRFYCDVSHLEPSASRLHHNFTFFLKSFFSCKVRLRLKREDENKSWCLLQSSAHLLTCYQVNPAEGVASWLPDFSATPWRFQTSCHARTLLTSALTETSHVTWMQQEWRAALVGGGWRTGGHFNHSRTEDG